MFAVVRVGWCITGVNGRRWSIPILARGRSHSTLRRACKIRTLAAPGVEGDPECRRRSGHRWIPLSRRYESTIRCALSMISRAKRELGGVRGESWDILGVKTYGSFIRRGRSGTHKGWISLFRLPEGTWWYGAWLISRYSADAQSNR